MKKAIIVGAGPAGISAAVYLLRAGVECHIIYKDNGALGKTSKIENYYGFADVIAGQDLFNAGVAQAERLGAHFYVDEVVGLTYDNMLGVIGKNHRFEAPVVILATGTSRYTPKIPGIDDFEGRGVSYCAVCDAFFYRNKHVGVLGSGDYALHEAGELVDTSASVTIYTNGEEPKFTDLPEKIQVDTRKIRSLIGTSKLESVEFEDYATVDIDGFFVAVGVAGSTDLARKVGAQFEGKHIVVDDDMNATLPGLYACGDCIGGMLQICKAVADGAKAAAAAIKYLRKF